MYVCTGVGIELSQTKVWTAKNHNVTIFTGWIAPASLGRATTMYLFTVSSFPNFFLSVGSRHIIYSLNFLLMRRRIALQGATSVVVALISHNCHKGKHLGNISDWSFKLFLQIDLQRGCGIFIDTNQSEWITGIHFTHLIIVIFRTEIEYLIHNCRGAGQASDFEDGVSHLRPDQPDSNF